jgi:hypothetical protein
MADEVTLVQRAEMIASGVKNRARNIAEYLDELAGMEASMKLTPENLTLFRLCIRSIRADVNSLANEDERKRV